MRIAKTKQTRKGSRRSTPPFSPLLGMLGGVGKLPQVMKLTSNGFKPVEEPAASTAPAPVNNLSGIAPEPSSAAPEALSSKVFNPFNNDVTPEATSLAAGPANIYPELMNLDIEHGKTLSNLIKDADVDRTLKLLKSVIYGINKKTFSDDIKEYESVLNHDKIQKGTLNLEEAQQAIAAALWKKLVLTLSE
jgi:hypothetical protein